MNFVIELPEPIFIRIKYIWREEIGQSRGRNPTSCAVHLNTQCVNARGCKMHGMQWRNFEIKHTARNIFRGTDLERRGLVRVNADTIFFSGTRDIGRISSSSFWLSGTVEKFSFVKLLVFVSTCNGSVIESSRTGTNARRRECFTVKCREMRVRGFKCLEKKYLERSSTFRVELSSSRLCIIRFESCRVCARKTKTTILIIEISNFLNSYLRKFKRNVRSRIKER